MVFFFPLMIGAVIDHDMTAYFYFPFREVFFRHVARGDIPLWNPSVALGYYQVGNPLHAYFYPLNVLFLVLPFDLAFSWMVLFHYLLAGMGMYVFIRSLTGNHPAATISAGAYMLGGVMLSLSRNIGFLFSMAWHPVILFALDAFLRSRKRRYLALLTGALACQFLNGDLQGFAFSIVLALVQIGFRALRDFPRPRENIPGFARALAGSGLVLGAAIAAALIVSMVQLLPLLDMAGQSYRIRGVPIEEAQFFSFHPLRLLNLFHPFLWGNKVAGTFWGESVAGGLTLSQFWYPSVYAGIVTIFLAAFSVLPGKNRVLAGCYLLLLLACFLLACGSYTAVWPFFFRHVPGFAFFRFPAKYFSVFRFCLASLAGIGFVRLVDSGRDPRERWILAGLGVITLAIFFHLLYGYSGFRSEIGAHPGIDIPGARAGLRRGFYTLGIFSLGSLGLLGYLLFRRRGRGYAALLLSVLLAADLLVGIPRLNTAGREVAGRTPEISSRIFSAENPHSYRVWYDVDAIPHFPSRYYRDLILPNTGIRFGIDYLFGNEPSMPRSTYELYGFNNFGNLKGILEFADIRYVLTNRTRAGKPMTAQFPALKGLDTAHSDEEKNVVLYRNPGHLPRAFTVTKWVWALDDKQAFAGVFHPDTDLRKAAFVERTGCLSGGKAVEIGECPHRTRQPGPGAPAFSPAEITLFQPDRVIMETEVPAPGMLVWCDSYYPGWRARVNGRETEVYRVNYAFKGIFLEEGINRVEFEFMPASFFWGKRISLFSCIAVGVLVLVGVVRRKRSPRSHFSPGSARAAPRSPLYS